jgi:Holliday junction resolvase
MTPEAKVKKKVITILKEHGAFYFTPVTGGFGHSGIPDIVACFNGKFIGIECKAGDKKPTALQNKVLEDIRSARGFALVVNESNLQDVVDVINFIKGE